MATQLGDSHQGDSPRDESARYKYQRLRDRLRQAITAGELAGKLPGERELARRYEANAKTINKALCDLTTEGLLVRHVGRGTFVAEGFAPHSASRRKQHTYAWLASGSQEGAATSAVYRSTEAMLRDYGHRLVLSNTGHAGSAETAGTSPAPSQLRAWDGLILTGRTGERLLAELHRRHLPVVMVQNTHARIRLSAVLPDYAQGAFELTQHLVRLGHEHIRLLIQPELLPAGAAAEQGYRAALQRNGLRLLDPLVVSSQFDWAELLSEVSRPTAILCVGTLLAARAGAAARDARLRVPASLSLAAVLDPGTHAPDLSLTAYEVSAEMIAHWVVDLLLNASPGQIPRTVIVPGELHDRGSTASPATQSASVLRTPSQAVI